MEKKLAIVTGGTRGIGESISLKLKENGYHVAANFANNKQKADEFTLQTGIKTYQCDVRDFDKCGEFINNVETDFKMSVSVLINNAGITRDGMLHKALNNNNWHDVIDTNLTSCFNMISAVINQMREAGYGRIVNISSINGLKGQAGQVNYSAAKSGILGLTKALALESAAKNITVNSIAPGYIETEMTKAINPEVLENIKNQIPVKRLGTAEEVARLVLFLVDPASGFITGETISINGGQHMG